MTVMSLPVLSGDNVLESYLSNIKKYPILSEEEEFMLAKRFVDYSDLDAAHKMVTSHLRLVVKIAFDFRHYGLPVADLVSEGNVGLMRAVKKFDPDRGFRLSTYAMWWIKAHITEYVLKSWSLVKMGTVAVQKKLFFGLRKAKAKLGIYHDYELTPEEVLKLSENLDVNPEEIVDMNRRISGDISLNAKIGDDSDFEKIDLLEDNSFNQEENYVENEQADIRDKVIKDAMGILNEREQHIIRMRKLVDEPMTLEALGEHYGISRERVRQIEARAFEKFTKFVLKSKEAKSLLPAN